MIHDLSSIQFKLSKSQRRPLNALNTENRFDTFHDFPSRAAAAFFFCFYVWTKKKGADSLLLFITAFLKGARGKTTKGRLKRLGRGEQRGVWGHAGGEGKRQLERDSLNQYNWSAGI